MFEAVGTSSADLQKHLRISRGRFRELAGALEAKGLVSRSSSPGDRQLVATPPDVALEVLVEIVQGNDAILQRFAQL